MRSISVIVPTLNRPDDLREFIVSLLQQSVQPNELVIVEANSRSKSEAIAQELMADSEIKLLFLLERPGSSRQRNTGIEHAQGDVLFFFDDDVILEPTYIEQSLACFQLDHSPPVGGVLGTFTPVSGPGPLKRLYHELFGMNHADGDRPPYSFKSGGFRTLLAPRTTTSVPVMSGGRTAYLRECLERERFEQYLPGLVIGEDIELAHRVARHWTLVHTPDARLFHKRSEVQRDPKADRIARIVFARYFFFKKHMPRDVSHLAAFAWANLGRIIWLCGSVIADRDMSNIGGIVKGYRWCWADFRGRAPFAEEDISSASVTAVDP